MPKPKDYGTAVDVHDGVIELKTNSFVTPPEPEYMRWLALLQFSILTMGTAISVGAHTVIVDEFRRYFKLTIFEVDFLNTVFLGSYLIAAPFVLRVFTKFGLKNGMRTASALFLTASLMKLACVFYPEMWVVLIVAQFLTSVAINFAMAGPSLLSATWFPDTERTLATTVCSQADNIGIALSFLGPSLIITPERQSERDFLMLTGIIVTIALVDSFLTFFVVPAAPTIPLSIQAIGPETEGQEVTTQEAVHPSLMGMYRSVSHSKSYLMLSLCAAAGIAVYWTYSAIFAQILLPYGISESESGILGAVKILLSVVPATIIASHVDKTRNYKWPLMGAYAVSLACFVGLTYVLGTERHPWWHASLLHIPMGVAQSVMMPLSLEYMVELTFPVDPSVSAGVFMYALRILCTFIVTAAPHVLPAKATRHDADVMMYGYTILSVAPCVLLLFVNGPLRRLMAEKGELVDQKVMQDAIHEYADHHHHHGDEEASERTGLVR